MSSVVSISQVCRVDGVLRFCHAVTVLGLVGDTARRRFIGGGRVRCLGLSMKFGRYTAHRRIQHACGARQQDSSCPILSFGLPHSVPDAAPGPFQPGVGLPRRSRGSPGDLGTVEWGNAVHVHEPSGISVRILFEGSLRLIVVRDGEGRTDRPCRRVDAWGSEPHDDGNQHASSFELRWRQQPKTVCH